MTWRALGGDCLDLLPEIPDGSIDAVIGDPPYGTTVCDWDAVIPFDRLWPELRRIIRPGGAICLFSVQPFAAALLMSNLRQYRHEWIWRKTRATGHLNAKRAPLREHENILVFADRSPRYYPQKTPGVPYLPRGGNAQMGRVYGYHRDIRAGSPDGSRYPRSVLSFASERGPHPTQKPVDLLSYLVRTYTQPGETVLDFSAGVFSTGVACVREGRNFVGIELDSGYLATGIARIERESCG